MCAIFGIGFMNESTVDNKEPVKRLLERLLLASAPRGRRATGVAFVSDKEIAVLKSDVEADKFVDLKEYNEACEKYINPCKALGRERTISIIGHCRWPTKGSVEIRDNNHPIIADNVVGVHNGVISNDDILFNRFGLPRRGRVDSEVIFQLLNFYIHCKQSSVVNSIQISCGMLNGDFACAFVDSTNPYMLWLFRDFNPLYVQHFEDDGLIIFASNPDYIDSAVKGTLLGPSTSIGVPSDSGMGINLFSNTQHTFDLLENYRRHRSNSYDR